MRKLETIIIPGNMRPGTARFLELIDDEVTDAVQRLFVPEMRFAGYGDDFLAARFENLPDALASDDIIAFLVRNERKQGMIREDDDTVRGRIGEVLLEPSKLFFGHAAAVAASE